MRRLLTLTFILALALAGTAQATIDWAGNAYPNSGDSITPVGDQFVVAQVYKAGVTDVPDQGADIGATLFYTTDIAAQASVPMAYNTDIGGNDEYIGFVPQTALIGAAWVDVTVVFDDLSDASTFEITGDQNSNPPPLRYTIVDVTPNDVTVTFTICMDATTTAGPPCVIGGNPAIGDWGSGVMLTNTSGDIWTADVVFASGSNPTFEYKYRKDVCQTWEDGIPNRVVTLPTDGATTLVLGPDSWENAALGCGLGSILTEDKVLCIQVCMEGIETTGALCLVGSLPGLDWDQGVAMAPIGVNLYQACLVYPAGTPYPILGVYKFRKDGCDAWESVADRPVTIDDASLTETTLTHAWDDGPGTCAVVPTEDSSWGAVKAQYR